jgi:DNA invertase Pin-like site-specific DNA recombinase
MVPSVKMIASPLIICGKAEYSSLRQMLDNLALDACDVVMVTRLDRLARSTRNLSNTLAAITAKSAGFRSLGDIWADTTTPHGRLMLTVLGGLAEFERDLYPHPNRGRQGASRGARAANGPTAEAHRAPAERSHQASRPGRNAQRHRPHLQRPPEHDFAARSIGLGNRAQESARLLSMQRNR